MPAAFPWTIKLYSPGVRRPWKECPCTTRAAGWGTCPVWTLGGGAMAAAHFRLEESRWVWQYDVPLISFIHPQVLLVTGGYDGDRLDSTELLRPGSNWQGVTSARLPRYMSGVRVSTVDNRVLLFGELRIEIDNYYWTLNGASIILSCVAGGSYDSDYSEDILEYRDGSWRQVGEMKNKRSYHGQTSIKYEDFSDKCN